MTYSPPEHSQHDLLTTNTINADSVDNSPLPIADASHESLNKMERSYSEMSIERVLPPSSALTPTPRHTDTEPVASDEEDEEDEEEELQSMMENESTSEKIKEMFGIPMQEQLLGEFPCYLLRLVTLPGWLYLTTHNLCFYASLPSKEDGPRKSGYLYKKNYRASPLSYRYYFQLRNHVLSWYDSAENTYEPLGSIHLRHATDIRESRTRSFAFQIVGKRRRCMLIADSKVSQKEWMDDLRRAIFMARNSGNSVRIVLPFNKMAKLNKTAAFRFAEYIRVKVDQVSDTEDASDEYYFAYFSDINDAFGKIEKQWHKERLDHNSESTLNTIGYSEDGSHFDTAAFQNAFGNTSSGVSAMLIGALVQAKSLGNNNTESDTSTHSRSSSTMTSDDFKTTLSPPQENKNKQRNSWTFGWFSSPQSPTSPEPENNTTPLHNGTTPPIPSSKPSIPALDIAAAKKEENEHPVSPKNKRRFRSSSTASIRQLARQSLGLTSPTSSSAGSPRNETENHHLLSPHTLSEKAKPPLPPTTSDVTVNAQIRRPRSSSFRGLIKHARKHSQDHNHHHYPSIVSRSPSWWVNKPYRHALQQADIAVNDLDTNDHEQQELANEQLHKTFPMLGDSENVLAVFNSAFWRTLPYYGRLYFSQNYICFHSGVLGGRQKLAIPLADITHVRRLKSRGYYLLHGIGIVTKDMPEEIYFEFSSLDMRDRCYALFFMINTDQQDGENASFARPKSIKLSDILANSTEHALPPIEYGGPPLLSTLSSTEPFLEHKSMPRKSMHITCLTIGSRGDVQPYIALCKQLLKDGHRCRIASHGEYKSWVEEHGIEFRSIGGDPGELMKLCIDNGFLSYSFIKDGVKFFYTWFETLLSTAWEACQGTDVLIESPSAMVGIHMAEKLGIPYFRSMPFPWTRTTRFPHPFAMQNYYTGGRLLYNDMTYVMIDMALWTGTSKTINRFRRKVLGLSATTLEKLELWRVPHIYSFSPTVLPQPKDWPEYMHCTGYWFLDNPNISWQPDPSLVKFLQAENDPRPIIYIGFGSIIVPDPEAVSRVIVDAVHKANVRAIICKGWSSRMKNKHEDEDESSAVLNRYPDMIYKIDSIPHDWLFPQIQGVVHHGGAGTTAAGLRAGLPTVIKPFFGDQRFWGQRVEELGVGVCLAKLTVDKLSDALMLVTRNNAMINKANMLGTTIRQENGVKTAVECIYRDLDIAKRTSRYHQHQQDE
ncbi:UDP-Glycosyltransferase/glycogen phosphorylase [Lichtheimia hyalospora FSU 10163]|nr:UDP-Glycosyltransferase/glycogen phosphorylase [Lichtheimia hyalospora FSU 10163]